MMNNRQRSNSNASYLMRYAGLGAQMFVSLGIAVFAGYKADKWLKTPIPLLVWILPFIVLCMMIYKLIKETSKQNTDVRKK